MKPVGLSVFKRLKRIKPPKTADLLFVTGFCSLVAGVALWNISTALMLAGLILMALGLLGAKS